MPLKKNDFTGAGGKVPEPSNAKSKLMNSVNVDILHKRDAKEAYSPSPAPYPGMRSILAKSHSLLHRGQTLLVLSHL